LPLLLLSLVAALLSFAAAAAAAAGVCWLPPKKAAKSRDSRLVSLGAGLLAWAVLLLPSPAGVSGA
jgi:hypothetical protein